MPKRHLQIYLGVAAVWIAYAAITFLTPSPSAERQFGLSPLTLALLRISIIIPYLIAWLAGVYGALTLFSAAASMRGKEEGVAFGLIGRGILIMVCGLIATSAISALRGYLAAADGDITTLVIINNYVQIFVPLAGFASILSGARHLPRGSAPAWLGAAGVIVMTLFSILYVWLIFTNPVRQISADPAIKPTYYLPDAAIVLTIVIPFLAACMLAHLSILRIFGYYRGVTGQLYKQASLRIVYGLLAMINGALFLQALLSVGAARFAGVGLGPVLLIVYVLIFVQTLGFVYVAFGAKDLSAIERVMTKYEDAKGPANA